LNPLIFLWATLLSIGATAALAQCHDEAITFTTEKTNTSPIRLFLDTPRTIEAIVTIDCKSLDNLKPSQPLPYTFIVNSLFNHREVLRLVQMDHRQLWRYGAYSYHFVHGIPSNLPTVDYIYSLPYAGDSFLVGQSYYGRHSHFAGSPEQYAVDFNMPEGTPIRAARPGTVIAYRDDSSAGGDAAAFAECCNYIHIKHDDGTYAVYAHLRPRGVCVRLGQVVNKGTVIGYAGSTGWASCPHLHFMVYRVLNTVKIESVPFRMQTSEGILNQLLEGHTY